MARNIRKEDHPIQFQIARLRKRCAINSEKIRLIGKGLVMISIPFAMMYASRGIEKYNRAQARRFEANLQWIENMSSEEMNKIWKPKDQQAILEYVKKVRGSER